MKRFLILCCLCTLLLVGCSAVPQSAETTSAPETELIPETTTIFDRIPDDAIDLTMYSGEDVYHVLNDILCDPYPHVGKTICCIGNFDVSRIEGSEDVFPICVIDDGDGCSADYLEFVLEGEASFPESYPDRGELMILVGTLEVYDYQGVPRCHLVDAAVETYGVQQLR